VGQLGQNPVAASVALKSIARQALASAGVFGVGRNL